MKNLQAKFLTFLLICAMFGISFFTEAQNQYLVRADSLFKAKQYTQSLEYYQLAFNEKIYSPAMLLKMAYINEGLGKIGSTLYYLKLYELATKEDQVSKKTEELASKFNLTGYEAKKFSPLSWITNHRLTTQLFLTLTTFIAAIVLFIQNKRERKPWVIYASLILIISFLFYLTNINSSDEIIIISKNTRLMTGPSAGSEVAATVSNGNLYEVEGKQDVWLKIQWQGKTVFVKEYDVAPVTL